MSNSNDQLQEIAKKVEALEASAVASNRNNILIYGFIILIVGFYAIWVPNTLKEATTPEVLSSIIIDAAENALPTNDELMAQAESLANREINAGFDRLQNELPKIKADLATKLDNNLGDITEQFTDVLKEDFAKIVKIAEAQIKQDIDTVNDEDALEQLSTDLAEGVNLQLQDSIDQHARFDVLNSMLDKLRDNKNLTQQEMTQKKAIAYAWLLANDEKYRDRLATKAFRLVDKAHAPIEE